jgi:hypothetical protein
MHGMGTTLSIVGNSGHTMVHHYDLYK